MGGGSGGAQPTQTTTLKMSPEQKQLYNLALPGIKSFAATVPDRYGGSTIADFDPSQVAGQNMALNAASGLQAPLTSGAVDANKFLLKDIWNPESNPYLSGAIDAAVRPITERYQETVMPGIRDEFQGAGQQFGGSRRGVAEGLAARDYLRNVGDTSSKIVQDQYANNLSSMVKALGLAPQTANAAVIPAQTTSAVGDVRQGMAQSLLSEDVGNFNYDQTAPFLQSKELLALLSGIPGGTNVSTANNPPSNPMMSGLGGAMAGAQLGSMIMPGIGTLAGAGLGGLMAFL